ncbi:MAG TPA: PASTA domain-containing protein [Candidatus Gallibacteroides avistercoris]|uniref:PASTA domain-containing protein n=1 Tax=Candidatus Gallibacteroides avistercoris TaxID=2840833 RepID=A0A9D1M909_9BACT|nr:PASTA domain-containing protein [Candidatus Gallibacteroides avistercoris]
MMKIVKLLWSNLIIRNLIFIAIATGCIILGVMVWLNNYTRHNEAIAVPDLRTMQVNAAEQALSRVGLKYEIIDSVYTKEVAPGAIVEQTPEANSKVKKGRTIYLTTNASSVQTFPLPDIEEMSQRQAVATLRAIGFKIDSVSYVHYEYKDLVVGVRYKNRPVKKGDNIPVGSRLVVLVGDGYASAASNDTIPGESATDTDKIDKVSQEWMQ